MAAAQYEGLVGAIEEQRGPRGTLGAYLRPSPSTLAELAAVTDAAAVRAQGVGAAVERQRRGG
jgi:hypothetical protein